MSDFVPGLEGVVAFESEIAEPDKEGGALRYRGVDIEDLVGRVSLRQRVGPAGRQRVRARACRRPSRSRCRCTPATSGSTCRARWPRWPRPGACGSCSTSTTSRPATTWPAPRSWRCPSSPSRPADRASRWCRRSGSTRRAPIVERFMIRWRGEPDPRHVKAVDAYWASAAEHGMNASTFTARVIASTGADVAALPVRRGRRDVRPAARRRPVAGAAHDRGRRADRRRRRYVKGVLDRGERLMGFGHRVYRAEDPRARVLRRTAKELGAPRYEVADALEKAALAELHAAPPGPRARDQRRVLGGGRPGLRRGPRAHVHVDVHLRPDRRLGAHILEQKRTGRLVRPSPGTSARRPARSGRRRRRPGTREI